jgi:hypothetical protein
MIPCMACSSEKKRRRWSSLQAPFVVVAIAGSGCEGKGSDEQASGNSTLDSSGTMGDDSWVTGNPPFDDGDDGDEGDGGTTGGTTEATSGDDSTTRATGNPPFDTGESDTVGESTGTDGSTGTGSEGTGTTSDDETTE